MRLAITNFRRLVYLGVALAIIAFTGITSLTDEQGRASINLSMNGSRVLYGLTIAMSHYRFASPLYSYYNPVRDIFYTDQTMTWSAVNGLIAKVLALDLNALTGSPLQVGFGELDYDDKGVVLWYSAAFALFGPHLESIYMLYFAMLTASMIIFWLSFREDEAALMLLPLYALAHMKLAAYILAGNLAVMGTLLTTRPFAMLAALPTLHLALLMLRRRTYSPWLLAAAAAQIGYLLFIVAVRGTAEVQICFLLAVATYLLARALFEKWPMLNRIAFRQGCVWVPTCLMLGIAICTIVYSAVVPQQVRERALSGHLMWHSVLAGFVLDRELTDDLFQFAQSYKHYDKIPEHDELAYVSTYGFYQVNYHQDVHAAITGSLDKEDLIGPPNKRNIHLYEHCARTLFLHELKRRPVEVINLLLVNKTHELFKMLKEVLKQTYSPITLVVAFALGLLGGAVWLRGLKVIAPLIASGFLFSSISAYTFVPATHIMYDYAPYFYLGFVSIFTTAGALSSWVIAYVNRPVRGLGYDAP